MKARLLTGKRCAIPEVRGGVSGIMLGDLIGVDDGRQRHRS
jgi:hypothetical protein